MECGYLDFHPPLNPGNSRCRLSVWVPESRHPQSAHSFNDCFMAPCVNWCSRRAADGQASVVDDPLLGWFWPFQCEPITGDSLPFDGSVPVNPLSRKRKRDRNEKARPDSGRALGQKRLLTLAAQGEDRAQGQQAGEKDHAPLREGGNGGRRRCTSRSSGERNCIRPCKSSN
jgi:hypothetical protein